MIQENFGQNKQLDKILEDSHFQEILKAIILGKYAWACVLFLHFFGCDPLEYMSVEVYDKLVQENNLLAKNHPSLIDESRFKFTGLKFSWLKFSDGRDSTN
jgi:hypothetical protein